MTHTKEEVDALLQTNQHLVFLNDEARDSTVGYMKKCFQFNKSGVARVDCLHKNKCDRELIGHLIGLLTQNINTLQSNERTCESERSSLKERLTKQEQEINNLRQENKVLREKNNGLSTVMTRCGLSAAIRNCGILNTVVQLVKDDGFEKLEAAVRCFGSDELVRKLDVGSVFEDAEPVGMHDKSESPEPINQIDAAPPNKRQRRWSADEVSVVGSTPLSECDMDTAENGDHAFNSGSMMQPHIPQVPMNSVQLYYQLVAQQEIHKQLLFNQTQRTNSTHTPQCSTLAPFPAQLS